MDYTLFLGDRTYSSWSLRGWLLFEKFGLTCTSKFVDFKLASVESQLPDLAPARTVPTLLTPEGVAVWDSLAIAEELATRFPDAGLWPEDPALRATARSMTAEMHSGFMALRGDCPMHLGVAYSGFAPSEDVLADVRRLEVIWTHARAMVTEKDGPWLFGAYTAADAFFAPAAARIATYDLPVGEIAAAYVATHLSDPAFVAWRREGLAEGNVLPWYAKDIPTREWPGPA